MSKEGINMKSGTKDIKKIKIIDSVKKNSRKTMNDFKEFAIKGNVIDMAIGVIIGGAFGKIVTSFVNDIVMPLISLITGKIEFSNLFIALNGVKYATLEEAKAAGVATLNYGNFITMIFDFLIIAFSVFFVFKKLVFFKKKEEKPAPITTKECPYCKSTIHKDAVRCPNCTSELE
jgi:large conductance mechanosensitive channel